MPNLHFGWAWDDNSQKKNLRSIFSTSDNVENQDVPKSNALKHKNTLI